MEEIQDASGVMRQEPSNMLFFLAWQNNKVSNCCRERSCRLSYFEQFHAPEKDYRGPRETESK